MSKRVAAVVVVIVLIAVAATAQRSGRRGRPQRLASSATLDDFDGTFQFCRVMFQRASNGDGGDWSVDYPRADENLSIRLSELTRTPVGMDADGTPKHLLI